MRMPGLRTPRSVSARSKRRDIDRDWVDCAAWRTSTALAIGVLSALATAGIGCTSAGDAERAEGIGFSATFLDMDAPDDLSCLRVVLLEGINSSELFRSNVDSLADEDGNGNPELIIDALPSAGTLFELTIEGYTSANCSGQFKYVGRSGLLTLNPGERRFVDLALYTTRQPEPLLRSERPNPRFFATATGLRDGRVLIAGGFESLQEAPCLRGITTERCFEATASDEAWIFDPPSGRFFPIEGGLGVARGGHTATELEDGRVLIAGGAEQVTLAFQDGVEGGADVLTMRPKTDGVLGAHATFEVFEPNGGAIAPIDDLDRDGAPDRGRIVGHASDPDELGVLNQERFGHAAALTATGTVVLVGGVGSDEEGARTFEHFDPRRPGGYGVYPNDDARLVTRRDFPSAVGVADGSVWIVGGANATSNADLAEVWMPDSDRPSGVTESATRLGLFPGSNAAPPERPGLSLTRPQIAALNSGRTLMVNGWYGPLCPAGVAMDEPIFPDGAVATRACDRASGAFRNFSVQVDDGETVLWQAPSSRFQSFAAMAVLSDGSIAITGGIQDERFNTSNDLTVYDSRPADDGRPVAVLADDDFSLGAPRAFHAAAALRGRGVLVYGGLTISDRTPRIPTIAAEAFYL